MKYIEARIRPIPSADKAEKSLTGVSRIYVNREILLELTGIALENGKRCFIEKMWGDGRATTREASLWASADVKLSRSVVQMSKPFQDACNFKLGDQVKIICTEGKPIPEAQEVVLEDVTADQSTIDQHDLQHWKWCVKGSLKGIDDVFPGLTLKRIPGGGTFRTFRITAVNRSSSSIAHFVPNSTKVSIRAGPDPETVVSTAKPPRLQMDMISGLEPQVREINQELDIWNEPFMFSTERKSCGLVLDGGTGTGKTMLLDKICETGWGEVHRIHCKSDKLSSITEILQKARDHQPSIVVMDKFESLVDKARSNHPAVMQTIADFLDKLAFEAAAMNERPKVVVLAACFDYLTGMPQDLMDTGRFTKHINLPLPDARRRKAILSAFNIALHPSTRESVLDNVSARTHAYNGKDLARLVEEATSLRRACLREKQNKGMEVDPRERVLTEEVFLQAMQNIRPSAMHDINLKPPPVHWDDIGGQEEVKKSLQQALTLSIEPKEVLLRYISRPPMGFLLYGPPGCSKTMAAQALATESDLNFFAVKGAELLNMYVGESERQIRQLFQRAREAAPSIIFFDEIDSIGGQRSGFGSASGSSSSHSGLNVLTTLLNEMQGFELTQGVLVLAATNRPQALDPALLRPGRFDKVIYVGPPNETARLAIFRKSLSARHTAPHLDIEELARETEGFSGAETVAICEAAGWKAHEKMKEGDLTGIRMEDLKEAIRNAPRMITQDMLGAYETWRNKFIKGVEFAF